MIGNSVQNVTPKSHPTSPGDEFADDSLIHIIWRQKGLIGAVTAVALLAAGIYLMFASPVYTAASKVLVQRAIPLSNQPSMASDNDSDTFLYQEAELMRSVPILSMVLGGPNVNDMQLLQGVDHPLAFLKRELDVEVGRKDGIITVSLSSKDKDDAKQIVDDVVESYKAFKSKQRRDTASSVLALLEKDKDKTDADLATKLDEVLKFKQDNNTISFDGDKSNYIMSRANSLADELTKAHI